MDSQAASFHCADAARFFAMHHGSRGESQFYGDWAMDQLVKAADALGFDLVKREADAPDIEMAISASSREYA